MIPTQGEHKNVFAKGSDHFQQSRMQVPEGSGLNNLGTRGGGGTPRFWTPTTPPTKAPRGGGLGRGGSGRAMGGGVWGGFAGGGGSGRVGLGGGGQGGRFGGDMPPRPSIGPSQTPYLPLPSL